jgi:3-oxoacyl-[acyl-carrier protein] reductase
MGKLDGKVAIVTGASKGIGAAIARSFGEAGARVVVNYATSKDGAERVVSAIEATGGTAIAMQADVSKATEVRRLFEETLKTFGKLDVLVNNAAVYSFGPLESVTEEEFHRQYNINVWGLLVATQEAVKLFGTVGGSIINIGTAGTRSTRPLSALYTSTKGSVDIITKTLAKELGPRKIRVNSVNPGGIETEGAHRIGVMGSELEKKMIEETPLGRFGQPMDVAPVAVFLASDEAAWVTGELVHVTGGR